MMSTRRNTGLFVSAVIALYPGVVLAQPQPVEPPPPEGDVAPAEEPAEIQPPPEAFEAPPPEPPPPAEEPPPPEPPPQPVEPAADVEPEDDDPMADRPVDGVDILFIPGDGLRLTSADGDFRLQTRFRGQVLYALEWVDGEEAEHQLTLRRARITFSGHLFGSNNRYKIELALSPGDMGMRDNVGSIGATPDETVAADRPRLTPILDWYFEFTHLRDLSVRVGQMKVPFNRQRLVSSGDLQMVDRSIVNSEFQLDRDVGLVLFSKDLFELDVLRYQLGVFMARGRDSVGLDDFGMLYVLRLDATPLGSFEDMSETDFERSTTPQLGIGAAAAFIDDARRQRGILGNLPADGGTTDTFHFVADLMFKVAGFSAMSEFHLRLGSRDAGNAVDDMGMPIPAEAPSEAWGFVFQTGYLLEPVPIEPVVHFSLIRRIGDATESVAEDQNALGLGVNFFFADHPFKLQIDFFRIWADDIGDGENVFRAQLQASI